MSESEVGLRAQAGEVSLIKTRSASAKRLRAQELTRNREAKSFTAVTAARDAGLPGVRIAA